ncbi:MAG TPA: sigma factor-like helix-turn-helix DNA-binding protein, partial [Ilumatobacteraceae bacterium]|nr:sigma factor-like helix-turn-helix DNA-binding protein [Ilumatobacteraceae bacterium]
MADAEDVVQVVAERWLRADHESIVNPAAWLTTVTSRVGLDRLRARRRDRADYVGPWLPDPVVAYDDQPATAELSDSLTTAFLVLLEKLSPTERLVLLLADVFQQPFSAVAAVVGKSEAATRQLAVRARRRVASSADVRPATTPEQERLATEFVTAIVLGDQQRASALLADDVVLTSDGGPSRHAARRPVVGRDRVARFLTNVTKRQIEVYGARSRVQPGWVNGAPGFVVMTDDQPDTVFAFDTATTATAGAAVITAVYVMLNPTKLIGAA